ncbi:MAG: low affinity iron permease family protein [Polyangiales bacterium]
MKRRTMKTGPLATGPLSRFSTKITEWVGSSGAFAVALAVVVVWGLTGPIFHYSDTWQLVINTGTTVVTFLMVFLIQRSQNKESLAIQLKLNELVAAMEGASNRLVDVEDLSEEELRILRRHYVTLAEEALKDGDLTRSHSVDEATHRHAHKMLRLPAARRAQHH